MRMPRLLQAKNCKGGRKAAEEDENGDEHEWEEKRAKDKAEMDERFKKLEEKCADKPGTTPDPWAAYRAGAGTGGTAGTASSEGWYGAREPWAVVSLS